MKKRIMSEIVAPSVQKIIDTASKGSKPDLPEAMSQIALDMAEKIRIEKARQQAAGLPPHPMVFSSPPSPHVKLESIEVPLEEKKADDKSKGYKSSEKSSGNRRTEEYTLQKELRKQQRKERKQKKLALHRHY